MWYIIVAVVWIVGIFLSYQVIKKWNLSKAETIYFSIIWPCLIPLYIVHILHNKVF